MRTSKKFTLSFVLLIGFTLVLSACGGNDDGSGSSGGTPIPGQYVAQPTATTPPDISCEAIENNPRGSFNACMSTHCSLLKQELITSYSEMSDVDTCSTDGVVAICALLEYDVYYYEGDLDAIKSNCAYNIGEFTTP